MNRFTITMLPNTMNDRKYTGAYGEWARAAYSTFSQLSTVAHRVRVTRAAPKVRKVLWGLSKLSCPPKRLTPVQVQAAAILNYSAFPRCTTRRQRWIHGNTPRRSFNVISNSKRCGQDTHSATTDQPTHKNAEPFLHPTLCSWNVTDDNRWNLVCVPAALAARTQHRKNVGNHEQQRPNVPQ